MTEQLDIRDGEVGQPGGPGEIPAGAECECDGSQPPAEGDGLAPALGGGSPAEGLNLVPLGMLSHAADCLRVMAHPLRLHIVDILMQAEMPVHQIAQLCDLPPHQACEHLRLLKGHSLLDSVRRGRTVYYRIADPRLPGLLNCIRGCCGLGQPGTRTNARTPGEGIAEWQAAIPPASRQEETPLQ